MARLSAKTAARAPGLRLGAAMPGPGDAGDSWNMADDSTTTGGAGGLIDPRRTMSPGPSPRPTGMNG